MVRGEEHHSRLGIKGVQRQQQVEVRPPNNFPLSQGVCEIDLFASHLSTQLPYQEALLTDALTMDWAPFKAYAFPPFKPIPAVLNKGTQDKGDVVIVAPIWAAQPWRPLLLSLLVEHPVLLPSSRHLLKDSSNVSQTTLSHVSCLRGQCQALGIPDNVT